MLPEPALRLPSYIDRLPYAFALEHPGAGGIIDIVVFGTIVRYGPYPVLFVPKDLPSLPAHVMRPAGLVAISIIGVRLPPDGHGGVRLLLAIGIGIVIRTLFLLLEIVPVTSVTLVELGLLQNTTHAVVLHFKGIAVLFIAAGIFPCGVGQPVQVVILIAVLPPIRFELGISALFFRLKISFTMS